MLKHALLLAALLISSPVFAEDIRPVHGLAMHGAPKYAADFKHLDYINPDAPKGGVFRQMFEGTFDSLNPFIIKGNPSSVSGLIYQTLLEQSADEAFTEYGLLAASVEVPEDRSWVIFNLRPEAKWNDGVALTADDVVWSFNTLTKEGLPSYRLYYANVKSVEALSPARVKFTFDMANNRELPLIIGQMPILPKHYWTSAGHKFSESTLTPPLGSGPYKFGTVKIGDSIDMVRITDWWAKDLPINKGRYNFDTLSFQYFRDSNVALEAFFGNRYDFRLERSAKLWNTAYNTPQVKDGRIKKETIANQIPQGAQGFIYNTRRPVFADRDVRKALAYAFDFEWSNKQYAFDAYTRTHSFFSNSEMAADKLPDADELKILAPYKELLPPELFTTVYAPPKTDGTGNIRDNLKAASDILTKAGYVTGPDGIRANAKGTRLEFEFVTNDAVFERWILPFIQNLKKIGVKATFRTIDDAQYESRMKKFDFDMTIVSIGESSSPGNEQREFWGSDSADTTGGRNYTGIKSPVVDALVKDIVSAKTREDLVLHCRALDRVLQWNYLMIPNWYLNAWRIAYWDQFEKPAKTAQYSLGYTDTWWSKPAKK